MVKLKESFSWLTPGAFKIEDVGVNTIKIKGIAIPKATTSKNKRTYIDEELIKSARTWIGKPITINHDSRRIVGHVDWMEYDKGAMEYLATVNKQPYVNLIRNKDPKMQGVSIEADYLYNRCRRCNKRFYDAETFIDHMHDDHGLEVSEEEPHGIKGSTLSLVVSPELPGVAGTSIKTKIFESFTWLQPNGMSQLLETVTQNKIEEEDWRTKMKKTAVVHKQENRMVYNKQLTEDVDKQGEQPPAHPTEEGGHECPEGTHWDEVEGTCVHDIISDVSEGPVRTTSHPTPPPTKVGEQAECPEGQHKVNGECVPITEQEECPEGEHRNADGECVPITEQEDGCPKGQHKDAEGNCVPIVAEQEGHCPPGFTWDPIEGVCVAKEMPASTPPTNAPQFVPEPPIAVPKVDTIEPAPAVGSKTVSETDAEDSTLPAEPFPTEQTADASVTQTCPTGSHWDEVAGTCVPDLIPEEQIGEAPVAVDGVTVGESIKLPRMLTLGEPTDEHGCEPNERWNAEQGVCVPRIDETLKSIPAVHQMNVRLTTDNIEIAETLNQLNRASAVIATKVLGLPKRQKTLTIAEASLRVRGDKAVHAWTKKALLHLKAIQNETMQKALDSGLAEALKKLHLSEKNYNRLIHKIQTGGIATSRRNFNNLVEYIHKRDSQLASQQKMQHTHDLKLMGHLTTQITAERKLNRKQCANISLLKETLKDVTVKLVDTAKASEALIELNKRFDQFKEQADAEPTACPEGQHRNEQGECVADEPSPEAEETKKKIMEMEAKIDNLEAKQKGEFKAVAPKPKLSETKGKEYVEDKMRTGARKKHA